MDDHSTPDDQSDLTPMPVWVKWFLLVAALVVLVLLVAKLTGVEHGPGLHSAATAGVGMTVSVR